MQTEVITEEVFEADETPAVETESVEDTVRKVFEDLSKNEPENNNEPIRDATPAQSSQVETPNAQHAQATVPTQESQPEKIDPPQSWTAQYKEWFHTLPTEARKELSRTAKEHEAHQTRLYQELHRNLEDVGEVKRVLDHYRPKWGLQGLTDGQAIAQLAAANDIIRSNPVEGLSLLIRSTGVTLEQLAQHIQGGGAQKNPQPEVPSHLLSELNDLKNWKQQLEQSQFEQRASAIAQEIAEVRDTRDQNGRYLYPALHSPEQLQRVQQLVSALKETNPQLSWGECTKRACSLIDGNGSPSLQSPGLTPAAQTNNQLERAKQASVSARLRGGSRANSIAAKDIPSSIEDTVRLAMRMNERG